MGQRRQRLAVLAVIVVASAANVASADNKTLARDLFNLGIDEYKSKQYDAAAASLSKSHALDPRPDALYALAQSERLAGRCKEAIPHYEQLLADAKDEKSQTKIKENIEICKQIEAGKPAPVEKQEDAKSVERDAPTIEYRTVVRTERSRDVLSIVLFAGGGVAISGSVAMYLVARSQRNDADNATTLEEYNDKYDSSRRLKWISYASAGVGVSLITVALVRVIRGDSGSSESSTKQVAVTPLDGGSLVSFSTRW